MLDWSDWHCVRCGTAIYVRIVPEELRRLGADARLMPSHLCYMCSGIWRIPKRTFWQTVWDAVFRRGEYAPREEKDADRCPRCGGRGIQSQSGGRPCWFCPRCDSDG